MSMYLTLDDVRFCAEECKRQQSGEISVYNMTVAQEFAKRCYSANTEVIKPWIVRNLGRMIEPEKAGDYRHFPVTINDVAVPWENIEQNIETLCSLLPSPEEYDHGIALEFYFNFEKIHPFADGNGRVGAILFNWINGTLFEPTIPPEYNMIFSLLHAEQEEKEESTWVDGICDIMTKEGS